MTFNKKLYTAMAALMLTASGAVGANYFGYAPIEVEPQEVSAHGTAMNNFVEAVIRLDVNSDPLLAALAGQNITGVRCFLRTDYEQTRQQRSLIYAMQGELGSDPVASKVVDLKEGWNEVLFDTPVEIGTEPLYVGYQVFETKGDPYPAVAYNRTNDPDGFFIRTNREAWRQYTDRGVLLIQAIVDAPADLFSGHAFVQATGFPLAIAPGSEVACDLYVHNQSAQSMESLVLTTTADNGATVKSYDIALTEPIPAFGSRILPFRLTAPMNESAESVLEFVVSQVNGQPAADCRKTAASMYITADAFTRVPLIEEFTGLTCNNCPFMFYYLDMALEEVGPNHIYVAHHAGFQNDVFTNDAALSLLYLFGGYTYNPAAMFDRRVLSGRDYPTIAATSELSGQPYLNYLDEAARYPAQARVLVDLDMTETEATVSVSGKIASAMFEQMDNVALTCFLVEDGLTLADYPQLGISDGLPDGAPEDLEERFRHNGLTRVTFNSHPLGDPIQIDADGNFAVDFPAAKLDSSWKRQNMRAVAIVHKVNSANMADNYVLNAGSNLLNHLQDPNSLATTDIDRAQPVETSWFDLTGRRIARPQGGLFIRATRMSDGSVSAEKIIIP